MRGGCVVAPAPNERPSAMRAYPIRAEVLKVEQYPISKETGKPYYYVFLKSGDYSFKCLIDSGFRNYSRWKPLLDSNPQGKILNNLTAKDERTIDADSLFSIEGGKDAGEPVGRVEVPTSDVSHQPLNPAPPISKSSEISQSEVDMARQHIKEAMKILERK